MLRLVTLPAKALRLARAKAKKLNRHTRVRKWRARYVRKRSSATYIGVTGSSAKSTTTALIAHIISGVAPVRVQVTNNGYHAHIRALQTPPPNHGYFVGEIGAEGPGTPMPMLDLIKPTVGVVTIVRLEHKSAFRSLDAVMEEKGRLRPRSNSTRP